MFLIGSGFEFEEGRDAERVAELVEVLGIRGYLAPLVESSALRIGVGEDDDAVLKEGLQKLGLELLESQMKLGNFSERIIAVFSDSTMAMEDGSWPMSDVRRWRPKRQGRKS